MRGRPKTLQSQAGGEEEERGQTEAGQEKKQGEAWRGKRTPSLISEARVESNPEEPRLLGEGPIVQGAWGQ